MVETAWCAIWTYTRYNDLSSGKLISFQIFCDQVLFAPFGLTCFYVGLSALEFKSIEEIYEEWLQKLPKTWMVSISQ